MEIGASTNLLAWIRFAIQTEEKSLALYTGFLKKLKSAYPKQLFRFLIGEEKKHKKILTSLLHKVAEGDEQKLKTSITAFKKLPIKNPMFNKKDALKFGEKNAELTTILNMAINFEKFGVKLYAKIEKKQKNKEIKSLFKNLAAQEMNHKKIIEQFGLTLLKIGFPIKR